MLLLASIAFVAGSRDATAVTVVALLLSVCVSAAFELAVEKASLPASVAEVAAVALAAFVPGAYVTLPLVCYDLPRLPWRATRALAPVAALCATLSSGLALAPGVGLVAVSALASLLSLRCMAQLEERRELHCLKDDLEDRIALLREKNAELEDAREFESRAATLAERTRIAREIHDSVGHLLTRLVLQVEALKVVRRDDPSALEDLGVILDGLNEATSSMRRSVHALEDSGVDVSVGLHGLAASSGIRDVAVDCGLDAEPPAEVGRCILAVSREALTNAARHGHADQVRVRVGSLPGLWQVRVASNGMVPVDATGLEERGMGLRSMRERVGALGGTLSVRVEELDGTRWFVVFATMPRHVTLGEVA
ncbi:MAG: sensor histidine kinase [Parafannyhessea sp.]|uniref:sensor histidine kinase n=1 Tax=Parafannyhessea sp. TaxID=2847324 RepID=UPI003F012963